MNELQQAQSGGLESLLFTLKRQDDQSIVIQEVIQEMINTKNDMNRISKDIKSDVAELRDTITLTRSECAAIQSLVGKKAHKMTEEFFGKKVSTDLFLANLGHFRGVIYKRLKENFNVARYFDIRRVDYENAKNVIDLVDLSNLKEHQLRLTARQKEVAALNGDDISEFEVE